MESLDTGHGEAPAVAMETQLFELGASRPPHPVAIMTSLLQWRVIEGFRSPRARARGRWECVSWKRLDRRNMLVSIGRGRGRRGDARFRTTCRIRGGAVCHAWTLSQMDVGGRGFSSARTTHACLVAVPRLLPSWSRATGRTVCRGEPRRGVPSRSPHHPDSTCHPHTCPTRQAQPYSARRDVDDKRQPRGPRSLTSHATRSRFRLGGRGRCSLALGVSRAEGF
jgi:hypothetical protein